MSDSDSEKKPEAIAGWERIATWCVLAGAVALRLIWCLYKHFDSDEAQHLHVVWGWANGLLAYRDLFDNHTPLFHVLCVPAYWLLGERADLLILMRLLMLPLYGVMLWLTYGIGKLLYSARVGMWSVIVVGVFPLFFSNSLEFRPDSLWTVLWLGAVLLLLRPGYTWKKYLLIGVLLGAAGATSQKTSIMLMALAAGGVLMLLIEAKKGGIKEKLLRAVPIAAGFLIIPCAIAGYFVVRQAWGEFVYCVLWHNVGLGLQEWLELRLYVILPAGLVLIYWATRKIYKQDLLEGKNNRAVLFLLVCGYLLFLLTTMPVIYKQSFLPAEPLAMIVGVSLVNSRLGRLRRRWRQMDMVKAGWVIVLAVVLIEGIVLGIDSPWENETRVDIERVADVLRLTEKNDTVMDYKGELIFRRRGYYYVLEKLTRTRLKRGLMANEIPESLIASKTRVVTRTRGISEDFLRDNYISVGSLRVAGKRLQLKGRKTTSFEVVVPARYCLVTRDGLARGRLNGKKYKGTMELAAGRHRYRGAKGESEVALLWAQAIERGFEPAWQEDPRYAGRGH